MSETILDLAEFEVWLAEYRDQHRAGGPGSGRFARIPHGQIEAFPCADFAVIDYTVGPWPLPTSERDARIAVLQEFQDSSSGLFAVDAAGGDDLVGYCHTAYFVTALELLGARPLHPIRAADALRSPRGIDGFFTKIDRSSPGPGLCGAAAVASCFAVTGDVGPEWFQRFFASIAREVDNGKGRASLLESLCLTAIHERLRAPLPNPAEAVKAALALQRPDGLFDEAGPGWTEFAAVFILDRGLRRSGKRRAKVLAACKRLLRASAERLLDAASRETYADDPHRAAGAVSMLAALAEVLPGAVRSRRPLRLLTGRELFV